MDGKDLDCDDEPTGLTVTSALFLDRESEDAIRAAELELLIVARAILAAEAAACDSATSMAAM